MIMKIIIYIIFAIITQYLTYKWVKRIDKKERKKLKKWEKNYISEYAELWKDAHFDQLAIEKIIKEYEIKKKKEQARIKEELKNIQPAENFEEIYNNELEKANERASHEDV